MPKVEVSEDRMMEMMEQAAFDSVIDAVCSECGGDVQAEPDAREGFCFECDKVTKLICPASEGWI